MRVPPHYAAAVALLALITAAVFGLDRGDVASMVLTMVSVVVIFASVALLFGGAGDRDLPGKA
jgi:ABC-type multidrug transport system permease subunit